MKKTLLELVQDILSALDADEVNSIDDTVEADQVATIIKNVYLNMASTRNWSGQKRLITFNHSGTPEKPTHLKAPDNIKELHSFRYNTSTDIEKMTYQDVRFKEPDEFLRMTAYRNQTADNVQVVNDFGGTPLLIVNDSPPRFWTTFDDVYIVCDSYDREMDDALKSSKTQLHATLLAEFRKVDDFVPNIPAEAFQALFNEAKSVAFVEIKQMSNEKAEQEARRQNTRLARKEWQLHGGVKYPNYGRRSAK